MVGRSVLVTGARGMLAQDLIPVLADTGASLVLSDRRGGTSPTGDRVYPLDICDAAAVREAVEAERPDWIVNCAAYTAVDAAERDVRAAFAVNGAAVGNLARAARRVDARVLHVSTDYVFGSDIRHGERAEPFEEGDECRPCGVYGASKRQGEKQLLEVLPERSCIVRTSWLHGAGGKNFIDTIGKLATERDELKVVNDQFGSPTWTGWLARVIARLTAEDAHGVYHASSRGDVSWFDVAKEIVSAVGGKAAVLPQSTAELGRPAPRPAYSTFSVSKLEALMGQECPAWQDDIRAHLATEAK